MLRRTQDNTGSRARDHLANERTYLAWVRTALGSIALGLAIDRFLITDGGAQAKIIGIAFIALGAVFLGLATVRFYRVTSELDQGLFTTDLVGPAIVGVLVLVAMVMGVVFVVV